MPSTWYLSIQNRALRDEEVADLVPAVVENVGAPVAVLAAAGVGVLVQRRAVEQPQSVAVAGKMGRHPIQDHADAGLVQHVEQNT